MEFLDWQAWLDWLQMNPAWIGLAILLTAFVESLALMGIVVPGVAILAALAALAGSSGTPVLMVLGCGLIGAVLGDGISYLAGRYFRQPLLNNWPLKQHPQWYERGESFINKHGGKSIILGRFIGPVRPIVPMMAGMLQMPGRRYLALNLFSAIAWAPFYLLPGYLTGQALQQSNNLWQQYGQPALAVITVMLVVWLWRHLHIRLQPGHASHFKIQLVGVRLPLLRKFWQLVSEPSQYKAFPLGIGVLSIMALASWLPLQWLSNAQNWPYSISLSQQPLLIGFIWALVWSFQHRRQDSLHLLVLLGMLVLFNQGHWQGRPMLHDPLALSCNSLLLYLTWQSCKNWSVPLRQLAYLVSLAGFVLGWGWLFGWTSLLSINLLSAMTLSVLIVCISLIHRHRFHPEAGQNNWLAPVIALSITGLLHL